MVLTTTKTKDGKGKRTLVQGSLKMGCHAHIIIMKCMKYLQYKLSENKLQKLGLRTLREKKMQELKGDLAKQPSEVEISIMYFVSLPTTAAHHGHPVISQCFNDKIASKIMDIVGGGITEVSQVRSLLRHYVRNELFCDTSPPDR